MQQVWKLFLFVKVFFKIHKEIINIDKITNSNLNSGRTYIPPNASYVSQQSLNFKKGLCVMS